MNLFKFKQKTIPSGETVEVTEYERWSVRWTSINYRGYSLIDIRSECNFFLNENDAKLFAEQLEAAYEFVKTSGSITNVKVAKES